MSRKRILILGGGHAGVRCARELIKHRRAADEIEITVEHTQGLMAMAAVIVTVGLLLALAQARLRSHEIRTLAGSRFGYFAA